MQINNSDITQDILNESFKDKKLLTFGESGNFLIDSTIYGVKDITIFDVHRYQYYLIALKLLALQKLPYDDYKDFLFNPESNKYLSLDIMEYLFQDVPDYASIEFWKMYIGLKRNEAHKGMNLFSNQSTLFSRHLQSEKDYEKAREGISKAKDIDYLIANGKEPELNEKYDRIYLGDFPSSISNRHFGFFMDSLDQENLTSDGEIIYYIKNFYVPDPESQSGTNKLRAKKEQENSMLSKGKINILSNDGFEVTQADIGTRDAWVKVKKRH